MIRAGEMDRKAQIQTPTEAANAIGEPIQTWTPFATRWVSLLPLSGNEAMKAMATQGNVTHRVQMRYTPGLKPKMRLVVEGRTFEIMSVVERGRREQHELMVSEVVD